MTKKVRTFTIDKGKDSLRGYATSLLVGGRYYIKSEKTDKGERKTTEIRIKVEKVK